MDLLLIEVLREQLARCKPEEHRATCSSRPGEGGGGLSWTTGGLLALAGWVLGLGCRGPAERGARRLLARGAALLGRAEAGSAESGASSAGSGASRRAGAATPSTLRAIVG